MGATQSPLVKTDFKAQWEGDIQKLRSISKRPDVGS